MDNQVTSGLVGFSPKIGDKAFASYKKKTIISIIVFVGIIVLAVLIGVPIYESKTGNNMWFQGLFLIGLFSVIGLIVIGTKLLDKTWDGVVESKHEGRTRDRTDDGFKVYEKQYVIKIRKDSGGSKTHKWRNSPGLYHYYNIGDRVRHHKGFQYYEKYDKSFDTHIMCAACLKMNTPEQDICKRCKCPVLKNN